MAWASLAACHPLGQSILTGCVLSLRHTRKRFFSLPTTTTTTPMAEDARKRAADDDDDRVDSQSEEELSLIHI